MSLLIRRVLGLMLGLLITGLGVGGHIWLNFEQEVMGLCIFVGFFVSVCAVALPNESLE